MTPGRLTKAVVDPAEIMRRLREKNVDDPGYAQWKRDVQTYIQGKPGVSFAANQAGTGSLYLELSSGHKIRVSDHPSLRSHPKAHLSLIYPHTQKQRSSDKGNMLRWDEEFPSHNWRQEIDSLLDGQLKKSFQPIIVRARFVDEWPTQVLVRRCLSRIRF
jgi:hypothetical protein